MKKQLLSNGQKGRPAKDVLLKTLWSVFRFVLIFGLCFIILRPLIIKLLHTLMSPEDLLDSTIKYAPKHWSTYYWRVALENMDLVRSGGLTLFLSLGSSVLQMLTSAMVGYGLARFRFKGSRLAFAAVIIILLVPSQVYSIPQYLGFRYFGVGQWTVNLLNSVVPVFLLSLGCLSVKQCLYVYLMREAFRDLPKDMENAAYIDGASIPRTFVSVVLPNVRNMLITVFLFAFCWQWTDTEFVSLYFTGKTTLAMRLVEGAYVTVTGSGGEDPLGTAIARTAGAIAIVIPVIILAVVCQRFLVKSISRTGIAN